MTLREKEFIFSSSSLTSFFL